MHFSFNYVHLNPRPIRIFSHFCGLQRRGSATERRDRSMATDCGIETNPSALWLLPLSLLLSLLFLTALAIPRHHCSPPLCSPLFLVCLFSLASRQVDSTQLTCVRVCRTRSGECGVYLRCRATCHILGYLPQTVSPALSRPLRPLFLCASDQIPPRLVLDLCAVATDDAQLFLVATRNVSVQRATYCVPACL